MNNDRTQQHVHVHAGLTSCDKGHSHLHPGVTGPYISLNNNSDHYHHFHGITGYDHGHYHFYNTMTSTAIYLPSGEHTHHVSLRTSFNQDHDHGIIGYIDPAPNIKSKP